MTGGPDQSLPRSRRLIRSSHFQEAFKQSRVAVGRYMVARLRVGEDANRRLGIITSRKVGPAVHRSLARRRLREAWRRNRHQIIDGQDVLLIARRPIVRASSEAVESELIRLMKSLHVLKVDENRPTG